jgi:hypothetical protein
LPKRVVSRSASRTTAADAGGGKSEETMTQRPIVFLALIATWCAACNAAKSLVPPDGDLVPSSRFSVHQTASIPGDGGMLAYGEPGKVQVQYTVDRSVQRPPIIGYPGVTLPPQATAPVVYQVISCLSTDGATCLISGSSRNVAGDGALWNSLTLSEAFRYRLRRHRDQARKAPPA